jgi:FkbM family methyltransferase
MYNFNWGDTPQEYINLFYEENFINMVYQLHYKVKENDVVVDIGSNYGSFSFSIKDSNPKIVYCLEPSEKIFPILKENLKDIPCVFINKGISNTDNDEHYIDNETVIYGQEGTYSSIKFSTFINEYKIENIDFLKFDCEGGEYSIFTEENAFFIKNNVKNIAGEYHICGHSNSVENFIKFRNLYLSDLRGTNNLHVYDRNGLDITNEIFNDEYITYFKNTYDEHNPYLGQFMIHANLESTSVKKIPIIGTAVVNSSYWVSRLIMSIDYPVENFVIINNNGKGELDYELDKLKDLNKRFIDNIKICHMPANIGCSGAWNLIIKCSIMSPYWIIVNDDVAFDKGFLKELIHTSITNPTAGVVHGESGDFNLGSWDLFLIKDFVVKKLGLFDENCYPAYGEDVDYLMRLLNSNIERIVSLNSNYFHGDGTKEEYYVHASQTSKKDPELSKLLDECHHLNIEYLSGKWGPHWRRCNPNALPFLDKERSLSETTYDLEFLRKKYTGF